MKKCLDVALHDGKVTWQKSEDTVVTLAAAHLGRLPPTRHAALLLGPGQRGVQRGARLTAALPATPQGSEHGGSPGLLSAVLHTQLHRHGIVINAELGELS